MNSKSHLAVPEGRYGDREKEKGKGITLSKGQPLFEYGTFQRKELVLLVKDVRCPSRLFNCPKILEIVASPDHFTSPSLAPPMELRQQAAHALERLMDVRLLLHVPNAGGDGMNHWYLDVLLHSHDIDSAPRAGAEQIDSLGAGMFEERLLEMMVDCFGRKVAVP